MSETEFISTRVSRDIFSAVNSAAEAEGMERSEWLRSAIAQKLGKRPRHTLKNRVAKLEKQVASLLDS